MRMTEINVEPREITEHVEWVAEGQPRMCLKCEHLHYSRRRVEAQDRGPKQITWKYCEDPRCSCDRLRTA
jgi:hypothetical protein